MNVPRQTGEIFWIVSCVTVFRNLDMKDVDEGRVHHKGLET
jgi:hypothetical protein